MSFPGHIPRKRFGQHWLKDNSILEKIVSAAHLEVDDRVLEIGPGRGALSEKLLKSNASLVHCIELDNDLIEGLRKRFAKEAKFSLLEGDALSSSLLLPDGMPANKVVANIPYNITGPLLERLLGRLGKLVETKYQLLVLMVQKEVAQRILALPGESNFSAMSIRIQLLAKCRSVCEVLPKSFSPPPKVNSEVIVLEPFDSNERLNVILERRIETLLRIAFLSRRKKLRNTLSGICPIDELEILAKMQGISLDKRPQELSPMIWVELAKSFEKHEIFNKQ